MLVGVEGAPTFDVSTFGGVASVAGMAERYTGSYLDRSNGWRAVAILADIDHASLVERIPVSPTPSRARSQLISRALYFKDFWNFHFGGLGGHCKETADVRGRSLVHRGHVAVQGP